MRCYLVLLLSLICAMGHGQQAFTHADTLRGSVTAERAWWNLQHYSLSVEVDPAQKWIEGSNTVSYKVLSPAQVMQIDLQAPMKITSVVQDGDTLPFYSNGPAHFISLAKNQVNGAYNEITINYSGHPREAVRAPWDGGFSWAKDKNGVDFIATSCQGLGASIWWPCKDHMYDEPDNGVVVKATVPAELVAVSNGRLVEEQDNTDGTKTFTWTVENPINNYGVNLNIGDYTHFSEKYYGIEGELDMDYWVLSYNEDQAKTHFEDAPKMMAAFEDWFGPYPFYKDGYKLVEVPYWGMEHQSSVTYGNEYKKGMKGRDHTGTGWGLKFDFIIIHESGHEWFANSITNKDVADMWIHESFTTYSESIFVEYYYGKDAAAEYIRGTRMSIKNEHPLISTYGVNDESEDADMYYKGTNILHTLRQVVNDDEKWKAMFKALNKSFYHKTVTTQEVEGFIASYFNLDLEGFFDQYLRDSRVPVLEYRISDKALVYRWTNCIGGFDMPIKVKVDGEWLWLKFNSPYGVNQIPIEEGAHTIEFDPNFYVYAQNAVGL